MKFTKTVENLEDFIIAMLDLNKIGIMYNGSRRKFYHPFYDEEEKKLGVQNITYEKIEKNYGYVFEYKLGLKEEDNE